MHKLFLYLYSKIQKRKSLVVLLSLLYLITGVIVFTRINFNEDITRLIPKSEKGDQTTEILENLQFSDKITILISGGEDKQGAADAIIDSLAQYPSYVKKIQGRFTEENFEETYAKIQSQLPFFLDQEDYEDLAQKLQPDSIKNLARENFEALTTSFLPAHLLMSDPLGMTYKGLNKLRKLAAGEEFTLTDGYLSTQNGEMLILFVDPVFSGSETKENTKFVESLDRIQEEVAASFSVKVDMYGAAIIAVANAKQIKRDILTTVLISFTALMLILILYYRKVQLPLILFIPSLFGVITAIILLWIIKDSISAISLSIGAILLGVTVDYALHILTHYKESESIEELYRDITRPLIMSSSTTALAFLCLLFVNSEALKDLGIFAAIAVIASALFSLIIIPHLYHPIKQGKPTLLDQLARFPFEKSKALISICLIFIVISFFTFHKVGFNQDISQLNHIPEDIKKTEKLLDSTTHLNSKSLYLVCYAENLDSALFAANQLKELWKELPIIEASNPTDVVLSESQKKIRLQRWKEFWTAERKNNLRTLLNSAGQEVGLSPTAYDQFYELLDTEFDLNTANDWGIDVVGKGGKYYHITTQIKIDESHREEIIKKINGINNTWVIDRQELNESFLGHLKDDFNRLINLSFLAVILILWIFFKRLELVLIASIPIGLTAWVTGGLMGAFGIELNIFSSIVCTLIFGHGVDFSIFMTAALQKEYSYGKPVMPQYRISVLLAVLTTILAIGALIFAKHPALISISAVSLVGVFAAVLITFVFYPILFKLFITLRPSKGFPPFKLVHLLFSSISFLYFGIGSFLLSLLTFVFPDKWRGVISKFLGSVIQSYPLMKHTNIIGKPMTPSIWIANHSSFLDILSLNAVDPKTIFLVSDWVYESPLFGRGVQKLGFYPVSKGLDKGLDSLQQKVAEGYSLVIFPEGTRSTDNSIKRFHKGAFYLSEKFNLPIQPVLIHGASEALPKGEFQIRGYGLTLKFLSPILPNDLSYGTEVKDRTKNISIYFKKQNHELRKDLEGPEYFKEMILECFLYKEPEIIKEVKKNLSQKMKAIHSLEIQDKTRILHIGNDFGETDLLLKLHFPTTKVDSYIQEESRRDVAKNLYLKRNITYLEEMSANHDLLIISDGVKVPESFKAQFPTCYEVF